MAQKSKQNDQLKLLLLLLKRMELFTVRFEYLWIGGVGYSWMILL